MIAFFTANLITKYNITTGIAIIIGNKNNPKKLTLAIYYLL